MVDYLRDPNPKKAYGDAKVPLQLVPPAAMIAIARGLAEGQEKYAPWNWREDDIETLTYIGAIQRHLAAYIEGEEADPDSKHGKTHLEGAIASLAILIDAESVGSLIDNRPKKKAVGVLKALSKGSVVDDSAVLVDVAIGPQLDRHGQDLNPDDSVKLSAVAIGPQLNRSGGDWSPTRGAGNESDKG